MMTNLLDPSDYKTFINPILLQETTNQMMDWEYCLSFPSIRCMVKRPEGIIVNYLDETGDEHEEKLFDFSARVFLHELDHIEGRTMTHWKISEGNIDIIQGNEDRNKNLMTTVTFYKDKIEEMRNEFEEELFSDKRKYEDKLDEDDGQTWRKFKQSTRKDMLTEVDIGQKPAFEETMLLDTIRAMRRDRKDYVKEK